MLQETLSSDTCRGSLCESCLWEASWARITRSCVEVEAEAVTIFQGFWDFLGRLVGRSVLPSVLNPIYWLFNTTRHLVSVVKKFSTCSLAGVLKVMSEWVDRRM